MIKVKSPYKKPKLIRAPSIFKGGLTGARRLREEVTFPLKPLKKHGRVPEPKTHWLLLDGEDARNARAARDKHKAGGAGG